MEKYELLNKDILIIHKGKKKQKFKKYLLFKYKNFCLYEYKKYFLNILPPDEHFSDDYFRKMRIDIYKVAGLPISVLIRNYEDHNLITITNIQEREILNYEDSLEFWESLEIMEKLVK